MLTLPTTLITEFLLCITVELGTTFYKIVYGGLLYGTFKNIELLIYVVCIYHFSHCQMLKHTHNIVNF